VSGHGTICLRVKVNAANLLTAMFIVPDFRPDTTKPRPWYWTVYECADKAHEGRYYNFIHHPELIPEVLEDFKPFADRESVQRFYEFLQWINGPDSKLETNDCSFRPPSPYPKEDVFPHANLKIFGRVEFAWRAHANNLANNEKSSFFLLTRMLCLFLQVTRPEIDNAYIEIKIKNTLFEKPLKTILKGYRISLNYHVYGDTEDGTFVNHLGLVQGIFEATKRLNATIIGIDQFP
jgi:hypothetical protein